MAHRRARSAERSRAAHEGRIHSPHRCRYGHDHISPPAVGVTWERHHGEQRHHGFGRTWGVDVVEERARGDSIVSITEAGAVQNPYPRWVAATLNRNEGRDPLGLQTTTQDRLMPRLLPGILELSRRARYFSFHAFLLDEYRENKMPANTTALSHFVKRREWDLGLAVLHCPYKCDASPVGSQSLRRVINNEDPPYPRDESVESSLGGYGLYYRSPLAELAIVARAGTMLGDQPIEVDVLYPTDRARRLAETFRAAVEGTAYYQQWMLTDDRLPMDVIVEYAEAACLCRLPHLPDERQAVHDALFGQDPEDQLPTPAVTADNPDEEGDGQAPHERSNAGVDQRRRSVAHYLTVLDDGPAVTETETDYRQRLWDPPAPRSGGHERVAGQWAALIAKDVWQDSLCSIWSEWCRRGLKRTRELDRGLTWEETRDLAASLIDGPPSLDPATPTSALATAVAAGEVALPVDGDELIPPDATIEQLRQATVYLDTATSGLVAILELSRRIADRSDEGWREAASVASAWQPSLTNVVRGLREHVDDAPVPTVADTLWWLLSRFVLPIHERIAYSKLPEFTFRFRWEDGLLRFIDHGIGRFPLAAIRFEPLQSITHDLGLWTATDDSAQLTPIGADLVAEVFA